MLSGKEKVCEIKDPAELRSIISSGGEVSCAKCCATSNDPRDLCAPVMRPKANLFCE